MLHSNRTADNEDSFSYNVAGVAAINAFISLSSVLCEKHTRE
jgi:hypothetical protein